MNARSPGADQLSIIERTTAVLVRRREAVSPAIGATAVSAGVGPAVGKRWLVHHVGATISFAGAPAAGDRGAANAQILVGGVRVELVGVTVEENMGTGHVANGVGSGLVMDSSDVFRVEAVGDGSSVVVDGTAALAATEYDELT